MGFKCTQNFYIVLLSYELVQRPFFFTDRSLKVEKKRRHSLFLCTTLFQSTAVFYPCIASIEQYRGEINQVYNSFIFLIAFLFTYPYESVRTVVHFITKIRIVGKKNKYIVLIL